MPVNNTPFAQRAQASAWGGGGRGGGDKVFVLDDDPTGTQTVHGVSVLTRWDADTLAEEMARDTPAAFVLTNTRALPEADAVARTREIAAALTATGREFRVVSRSDSTLRGHFPAEVDALADALGWGDAPILLCPYFAAGGRITVGGVHYVEADGVRTPVAETEFARDTTFGYRHSDLREWVAEKTGGRIAAGSVVVVSPEDAATTLPALPPRAVAALDCAHPDELAAHVAAVHAAEARGRRFLPRTAASFAAAYAGIAPRPLLPPDELGLGAGGVLVVVGSYVRKSTEQFEALAAEGLHTVEVSVPALLDERRDGELRRAADAVDAALAAGEGVVVYTSRSPVDPGALGTGARIAAGLTALVQSLTHQPRALIVKGGITSSEIATDALQVRRASVLGQLAPGVAAWRCGPETRWPNLIYVVFPGNVGGADALAALYRRLTHPPIDRANRQNSVKGRHA